MTEPQWRVGETVPWTVAWSGEHAFRLQQSADFPGMVELVQAERPGAGRPVFAAVHVTRHRRGMVEHLCHVCGGATTPEDRWLFPVESGGFVTQLDGTVAYGGNVPPVHLACAERAARLCPHLRRAYARPARFPADVGRLIPRTDAAPGMEAIARTLPTGLAGVLACYRLHLGGCAPRRRRPRGRDRWPPRRRARCWRRQVRRRGSPISARSGWTTAEVAFALLLARRDG